MCEVQLTDSQVATCVAYCLKAYICLKLAIFPEIWIRNTEAKSDKKLFGKKNIVFPCNENLRLFYAGKYNASEEFGTLSSGIERKPEDLWRHGGHAIPHRLLHLEGFITRQVVHGCGCEKRGDEQKFVWKKWTHSVRRAVEMCSIKKLMRITIASAYINVQHMLSSYLDWLRHHDIRKTSRTAYWSTLLLVTVNGVWRA